MTRLVLAACAITLLFVLGAGSAGADEGWVITSFSATYTVHADGVVDVDEAIDVDFRGLEKHGIFRELVDRRDCNRRAAETSTQQPLYTCPSGSDRAWPVEVESVTDASGNKLKYEVNREVIAGGRKTQIKIGDPDRTISGRQSYRISYRVEGTLDAYEDHDELYWNASGTWPVAIEKFVLELRMPDGAQLRAACYAGYGGSTQPCMATIEGSRAIYATRRALAPNEQVTIVAGWQRGLVAVGPPILKDQPSFDDWYELDVLELGGAGAVGVLGIVGLVMLWWRHGRDRRYRTLYYLTNDPSQETKPLFGRTDIVVEFLPPEGLGPAQMGLILDERADTLDVTATIIDLAVRGYLHITEIPKKGWFGNKDWTLTKKKEADEGLLPYERALFNGLFSGDKTEVELSDLKKTFIDELNDVKEKIYADGMERKWFSAKPEATRMTWLFAGIGVIAVGAGGAFLTGWLLGRLLMLLPLVPLGLVLLLLSRAMARRTAAGSEALRRVLGFRLYIATAETRRQEFNEQKNIFARYLPFAIVFGCVEKWAGAFEGLEEAAAESTASWYTGIGAFQVAMFSHSLRDLSSSVTSTISSAPSSSGGSGFSGGFSGGGGGGGGGGSW